VGTKKTQRQRRQRRHGTDAHLREDRAAVALVPTNCSIVGWFQLERGCGRGPREDDERAGSEQSREGSSRVRREGDENLHALKACSSDDQKALTRFRIEVTTAQSLASSGCPNIIPIVEAQVEPAEDPSRIQVSLTSSGAIWSTKATRSGIPAKSRT